MSNKGYSDLVKESKLFEKYYKEQNIVPVEEWELFMEYLKQDLPSTFRVVGVSPYSSSIKEFAKETESVTVYLNENSEEMDNLIKEIKWYPKGLAFQITKSRDKLRRSSGVSKEFHSKLVMMSDGGSIMRQEAVSMLPVLFLDVKPNHYVLDLCSAPGSKTSQIIEILQSEQAVTGEYPKGFVIANDLDTRRAHMLIHHTRHLNSPSLIVTTHSADHFPDIYLSNPSSESLKEKFYFDRILCDVPCSSDGTLRKNPNLFAKWSISFSLGLHRLQRNILLRALSILKPKEGLLVYSTCSFNPLENEAVVSSVISSLANRGIQVEIVDPLTISEISKDVISKTKFGRGISTWRVPIPRKQLKKNKNKKNKCEETNVELLPQEPKEFFDNYEEVPFQSRESIFPSMFPPEDPKIKESLSKCIRISPHQENTGGFFVSVLRIASSEKEDNKADNFQLEIQDDYLTLADNPNKKNIIKMLFNPYGISNFNEEKILNTLIYRNPKGDFNRACNNKKSLEELNKKEKENKEGSTDKIEDDFDSINNTTDDLSNQELEDSKFPRKMWQVSESVSKFLFSAKSKNPLRVIHAGFPGVELSRYRKGPISIEDNQVIDVNFPPIYRFNCGFNSYLHYSHGLSLDDTPRCREFSIKYILKLLQTIEKPTENTEEVKEFHPYRIPRHHLKEEEYPEFKGIFDLPGSIIIKLDLGKFGGNKPIFLPAHVGRHHIELLLDKFLRFCVKFHIEWLYKHQNH
ncbi:SAM-dependent methyltransferase RsmB/NOP2-type [Cryptosporidium hominis]|uniref:SAM-dependent methyltransferase RsmB/NOP2-type n=1 Tax=Cryptosporidium hominis TaxID=237895 RepID=A0ABX5BEV9_CRYHO|nr:FLJ20303 protein [Cryptosporidium hominis TU502]PPS96850.1 SAM-dependent methyltransferase RsmB/NOP2-type [Cryptosporidium hominis]|eukprot:PPS96850.1 SAM-dependent methyltransferase RsmB/NOP2-type [Cryptosporidium hominis]